MKSGDLGPGSKPVYGKFGVGKGQIVGRISSDGRALWRVDFDPVKGPHINISDFRAGEGHLGREYAILFDGDEATVLSYLRHLQ